MHLVVGLGNPGREYENNRHNVGFMAADDLARALAMPEFKDKWSGAWTKGELRSSGRDASAPNAPLALLKPMTFMNLSGESVQPAAAFLKIEPANVIVLHDELDIPFGDVRLKQGGGHAGHNGLRSIITRLGTPDFVRVRIGIGRPRVGDARWRGDVADFVLHDFDASERAELPSVLARATDAVRLVVERGVAEAMKAVNTCA